MLRRLDVVFVSLVLAAPAWAQPHAAPADSVARPIPPALIATKAQESEAVLQSMADRYGADPETDAIRAAIPPLLGRAEDLLEATEAQLAHPTPARQMDEMERRLLDLSLPLGSWRTKLQRRARGLDRDIQTLDGMRAAWDATLQHADSTLLTTEIFAIVRDKAAAVTALEEQFNSRRAELFVVEEQIGRTQGVIEAGVAAIEAARERARMRLTTLDVPPVWEFAARPRGLMLQMQQLVQVWADGSRDARDFARMSRKPLVATAVLFALMLTITIRLGRRLRRPLQPEMEAAAHVLTRPLSASFIAAVLFAALALRWVPSLVSDIVTIALFLPAFRVLPVRLTRHWRLFLTLLGIHFLGVLSEFVIYLSLLQQLLLLVQGSLVLAVLLVMLRRSRQATTRMLHRIEWLAAVLVTTAIVADVVGNVSFAAVVLRAVVLSTEIGLLFYAVYGVLQGVLRAALGSAVLQRLALVRSHEDLLRRRTLYTLRLLLLSLWVRDTLQALLLWSLVANGVRRALAAQAHFGQLGISLGGVLGLGATIWGAFLLSRFLRFVLEGEVYPRLELPRGAPQALSTGLHYLILLFGFILAVAATGVELSKVTIIVSAFGIGVGFGLQNIINNFVSGLILMVERPIMAGDSVQFGQTTGEVMRIGMRSSTVRTWDGAEVIVPNANLIANEVTNWTKSDRLRRIDLAVGVAYGSDPQRVIDLLLSVASRHPDALPSPAPTALFIAFGASALDFQLRVWTANIDAWMRVKSEIAIAVHQALQQAGIEIPFPQRDLHLKSVTPAARQALAYPGERAPS